MVAHSSVELAKYSQNELNVMAISDIIQELVKAHEEGRDINLNKTKTHLSSHKSRPDTVSPTLLSWLTSSQQYP